MPTLIRYPDGLGALANVSAQTPLPVQDGAPLLAVTPQVSGASQSMQAFGDGTNDVFYLRVTATAVDGVDGGDRLKNGYPETMLLSPGNTYLLRSSAAITRVFVVAFGDTESGTPSAGEIATESSTAATIRSLMQTFTFDTGDDVRTLMITLSDRYSATTAGAPASTGNYVRALIEGRSHA